MAGRPDKHPGELKTRANQAGATQFVDPALVEGTLVEAYRRLVDLDTPWERSVLVMFVVSEVHPFDDGNGRTARVMMNAELKAGGNMRTIVPTVFREDYLGAQRRLSRNDDQSVLVKALPYANDFTARVDFSDLERARRELAAANAFEPPGSGSRLALPSRGLFDAPLPLVALGAEAPAAPSSDVFVRPYRRRDGTPVSSHKRGVPQKARPYKAELGDGVADERGALARVDLEHGEEPKVQVAEEAEHGPPWPTGRQQCPSSLSTHRWHVVRGGRGSMASKSVGGRVGSTVAPKARFTITLSGSDISSSG